MENETHTEEYCSQRISNCPSFESCSINICPLDPNMHMRTNPERKTCKWMKEAKIIALRGKKQGVQFVSGGRAMPDYLLMLVPKNNAPKLNKASFERWQQIYEN